jgi:hypothetical protein
MQSAFFICVNVVRWLKRIMTPSIKRYNGMWYLSQFLLVFYNTIRSLDCRNIFEMCNITFLFRLVYSLY